MCLWLREGNQKAVGWWYGLELLTKPLLNHSNMKELNWTLLTMVILWFGWFLCLMAYQPLQATLWKNSWDYLTPSWMVKGSSYLSQGYLSETELNNVTSWKNPFFETSIDHFSHYYLGTSSSILWTRLSLHGSNPSLLVSNSSVYSCMTMLLIIYLHIWKKIMEWPQASSPDLNPIKNLWLSLKMKLYKDSK